MLQPNNAADFGIDTPPSQFMGSLRHLYQDRIGFQGDRPSPQPSWTDPDNDMINLVSLRFRQDDAKPWLLILDNADEAEILTEGGNALAIFIPNYRNGFVIITTRDRYVAQVFTGTAHGSLTIDRLSPEDALTLFRSKLLDDAKFDKAVKLQILEILEHLPLCITQAAYIDRSGITLREYILELTESEASLLEILDEDQCELRRGFDSPNSGRSP